MPTIVIVPGFAPLTGLPASAGRPASVAAALTAVGAAGDEALQAARPAASAPIPKTFTNLFMIDPSFRVLPSHSWSGERPVYSAANVLLLINTTNYLLYRQSEA
jgi:hypothetical protein